MEHPVRVDDLPELRRRVVTPVVRSLLHESELELVVVVPDAPPGDWPSPPEPGSVWVHLTAVGETFEHQLVPGTAVRAGPHPDEVGGPSGDPGLADAQVLADDLYGALWDWLVETRFSWGERRYGEYEVPL